MTVTLPLDTSLNADDEEPASEETLARLAEMKADAERVLRTQAEGIAALDAKAQQLITLGVAGLAGAAAIGGFVADHAAVIDLEGRARLFRLLLVGVVFDVLSLASFGQAYVGLKKARRRGEIPDLEWLAKKANQPNYSIREYRIAVIQGFRDAFALNARDSKRLVRFRTAGVWLLFLALVAYIAAAMEFVRLVLLRS